MAVAARTRSRSTSTLEEGNLAAVLKGLGMLEGATPQEQRRARELLAQAKEVLTARPPQPSRFPHVEAAVGGAWLRQVLGER